MDVEAKIKEDMMSLGCQSREKILLAYHLYVYLIDTKLMYDTEYFYNNDLDTLYMIAKPSKNQKPNIYVPLPTTDEVTIEKIVQLQKHLCTDETGSVVNLAFIEGDLNTVIYSFNSGLVDLYTPEGASKRKTREERRNFIDSELKRNKKQILENTSSEAQSDDEND